MPRLFKDKDSALRIARIGSMGGIIFTATLFKDLYENISHRDMIKGEEELIHSTLNAGFIVTCLFIAITLFSVWQIYRGKGRVSSFTLVLLIGAGLNLIRTAESSLLSHWPELLSLTLVIFFALPGSWAYRRLQSQPNPKVFE